MRAYDGLSWDTPAGYYLSKAVPAVMRQMGICYCPVVENLSLDPIKNASNVCVAVMVSSRRSPGSEHGLCYV